MLFSYPQDVFLVCITILKTARSRLVLNSFLWITVNFTQNSLFFDSLWIVNHHPVNSLNFNLSTCGKLDMFMLK
ncbi:hypothetical protein LP314_00005 [Lactiplantibacillus pentosus]|nr:hypothetical protein LP314_00005 [Lactiplantibacillus pentosus]